MRNSGGTDGNIAAGLAVLGMEASIVCGLGDDETGEFLLEELKQSGVNTEHVKVTAGLKSGAVPIMVNEDGERVIYVLVTGSAVEVIEPEDLLFLEEMNPDALCFTGVIIGAHPVEESAILAARRWKGRAKLYFDPNLCYPADQVPEEIKKATRELADLCDVVPVSYTHLDNFLRTSKVRLGYDLNKRYAGTVKVHIRVTAAMNQLSRILLHMDLLDVNAVSYTHLDVYKRQVPAHP